MGYFSPNIEVGDVKKALIEAGQYIADIQLYKDTGGAETTYWEQTLDLTNVDNLVMSWDVAGTGGAGSELKLYCEAVTLKTLSLNGASKGIEVYDVSAYGTGQTIKITVKTSSAETINYLKLWGME